MDRNLQLITATALLTLGLGCAAESGPAVEGRLRGAPAPAPECRAPAGWEPSSDSAIIGSRPSECDLEMFDHTVVLEGIGWTHEECWADALEGFDPIVGCAEGAWEPGNCLDLECRGDDSQCVSDPEWGSDTTAMLERSATWGFAPLCSFDPQTDPDAPFEPMGPFTCVCKRELLCACACEGCDPGGSSTT